MFYQDSIALRPNAERLAVHANALLGSFEATERAAILKTLDAILAAFATAIGYRRVLVAFGPLCLSYLWTPLEGGRCPMRTDVDFIRDPDLSAQPVYRALLRRISRTKPKIAERLLLCLLIARDSENGDYLSIESAQDMFGDVQRAVNDESALQRLGRREGGHKKSKEDQKRRSDLTARVRSICETEVAASHGRAECWESVRSRLLSGEGYPSLKTLRRVFDEQFAEAATRHSGAT